MSGVHYITEPTGYLEPKVGTTPVADWPATTVIDVFRKVKERFPDRPALCYKKPVNGKVPADFTKITYTEYWNECNRFAKSLIKYDVNAFKIVNILGFNSPEWFIAANGSILAGCIAAGIYTTNGPDACKYISQHSEAEVIVLEGNKQLEKYTKIVEELPKLKVIVVYAEEPQSKLVDLITAHGKTVQTWSDFLKYGEETVFDSDVEERSKLVRPGNCASLIYTSGTTGPPKAVMISHDNITWTARNICDHYIRDLNHNDRVVSYLPLSHIAAQLIDVYCILNIGGSTWFAQPDALKGSLTVTMKEVKPTFFFGVPRVWEKIQEKMAQIGRSSTGIKKQLANYAKSLGTEKSKMNQFGAGGGTPMFFGCMNSLVLSKVKEALGLDQAKACFTAAAPIAPEVLWYFASLDIPVYEVFGQSECTGPHTVSAEGQWKVGYCGRPLRGSVSRLDPNNGELTYKGRHIFMGYMHMPKETADTIDAEGFLHSGDVSEFDENDHPEIPKPSGFMRITGRIKELLITAGGENVPPVLIENEIKAALVAVSNAMVIGDRRKFLSSLVSLKVELDPETARPTDRLAADAIFIAKQIGSNATLYSEAKVDPLWKEYINKGIKVANSKATSNAQIVQKWEWLPEDFSEKEGDLTPTLKLKRSVVSKKYEELIEKIYAESAGDA